LLANQLHLIPKASISLPIAALLGAALAFRPIRHGTPIRDMEVVHTQVILAVVGALIMLVIGDSVARAFGIVGAAGLIRYRARIRDPKDAGVMLSTLGVGLASGVGLYLLAVFGTLFLLAILWLIESYALKEPQPYKLKVSAAAPLKLQPKIEALLHKEHIEYELNNVKDDELDYELQIPSNKSVDTISRTLQKLETTSAESFTWKLKKDA
jgi:uncharacterized membrane protein YhiD involved in acid resistance